MPVVTRQGQPAWRLRTPRTVLLAWLVWFLIVAVLVWSWQFVSERTIWAFVADAPRQGGDLMARMVPPDWAYTAMLWQPLWDTINIATLGTLLAIVIATPLAFVAARNTTPALPGLRALALLIIVASRSINALIWALLLVMILGPGVLSGIIAIALRSIGFIGKLLYEAIEESDAKPVEAIIATGASPAQMRLYAIVPQVMPAFAGISVYRWDINIREATILGLVGAGGIGLELMASVNVLAWGRVSMIFLLILATVLASEWLSARVRAAVT
ncbi:MAG: phosphonate ABC transporter, permease protein PhnE [Gammaproteobacteria bacterium]|nr:MAG: phosphonate ABC transporter, permease protein PhnE [Gammaproteobacteria bacterium]